MKRRYRRIYFFLDHHPMLFPATSAIITFFVFWIPIFGSGERPIESIDLLIYIAIFYFWLFVLTTTAFEIAIRCDYYKVLKRYNSVKHSRSL